MITQVGTKYDSLDSAASGRVGNMMDSNTTVTL